ncbi:MAG: HAMP domain-containing histidine kinase [Chroococcidiopsidaceae cyanobacterium CP_BM_ER_R8_30]|nr:HAMP domain-containing histidine kinase [Chroococcidiopsidaceae cyanobacterium CP_BM_ER_R8_30]
MALLAFFLGLIIGMGLWFWQSHRFHWQLRRLLQMLQTGSSNSIAVFPRLQREIAKQQQQHQELQTQLQTYQELLQVAPLGYLQVDEENQLLWCNQQAQQLLGLQKWEPGQVRLLLELVRSYELDQLIEQTRIEQQPQVREWMFHPACVDAAALVDVRTLALRASSWPLNAGQVGVFLENWQSLVELNRARDRWVSDLAHELRTPLTSIRLVVETLQEHLDLPLRRWVDRLVPEVDRLINLVQNWLELSQLELDPTKQLSCQPVEVRTLLYATWQILEPLARQKQIALDYSGPETLWLRADKSRLTQVFLNLFDNSIKYSPVSGTIWVKVKVLPVADACRNQVQIDIIDSGPGFPDSDLPHVFQRLYRVDAARTREPDSLNNGSGLGLAIVQQIIHAHGGSVKARNHPDTGGAWLQVELSDTMADS